MQSNLNITANSFILFPAKLWKVNTKMMFPFNVLIIVIVLSEYLKIRPMTGGIR